MLIPFLKRALLWESMLTGPLRFCGDPLNSDSSVLPHDTFPRPEEEPSYRKPKKDRKPPWQVLLSWGPWIILMIVVLTLGSSVFTPLLLPHDAVVKVSKKEDLNALNEQIKKRIFVSLESALIHHQELQREKRLLVVRIEDPRQQESARQAIVKDLGERFEVTSDKVYTTWSWLPELTDVAAASLWWLYELPGNILKLLELNIDKLRLPSEIFSILILYAACAEAFAVLSILLVVQRRYLKEKWKKRTTIPRTIIWLLYLAGIIMLVAKIGFYALPQTLIPSWETKLFHHLYYTSALSSTGFYLYLLTYLGSHGQIKYKGFYWCMFLLLPVFFVIQQGEFYRKNLAVLYPDSEGHKVIAYEKRPRNINDLCEIFQEKPHWRNSARVSAEKYQVEVSTMMAFMRGESSFHANARNPGSTAFGYAQATLPTWEDYVKARAKKGDNGIKYRHIFADAADFVAFKIAQYMNSLALSEKKVEKLYLAYHMGAGGYVSGEFSDDLQRFADKVAGFEKRYRKQLKECEAWAGISQ